ARSTPPSKPPAWTPSKPLTSSSCVVFNAEGAENERRGRRECNKGGQGAHANRHVATAASEAGFTPAERAGVQGGAPLAPPSLMIDWPSFFAWRKHTMGLLAK